MYKRQLNVAMYESHKVTASENKEPFSRPAVSVTGRHSLYRE